MEAQKQKLKRTQKEISKPEDFTDPEVLYEKLINTIREYHPSTDLSMVEKAYKLARDAHKDQKRKSGEPYIIHPLCVAIILAELELDKETIVAGILHDVVEDTNVTFDELEKNFSLEVIEALKLLTHDKNVDYLEYVRKIKNNPIARKVKLADLYHNSDPTRMENPTPKDLERKEKYRKAIEILKY